MNEPILISLDWGLIARGLLALLWGVLYALFIQFVPTGQFLVRRRTWLSVVIGLAVDLALAFGGDWWTVLAVVAASSLGIIMRSLLNEQSDSFNPNSYNMKHSLEDAIAVTRKSVKALETGLEKQSLADVSRGLSLVHQALALMKTARRGQ